MECIKALTKTTLPTPNWSMTQQQQSDLWRIRGEIVIQRFGDDDNFKRMANPDNQVYFGKHPTTAVMGDYPTMRDIETAYGKGFAAEWLLPHIANLALFVGAKNLTVPQEVELARILAVEAQNLKVTEVLLFFYRLKAGHYGRFYGEVDPMVITCALREFMKDKNLIVEQEERKSRPRQRD